MQIAAKFFSSARGAGFTIRDYLRCGIQQTCENDWAKSEDDARGVTAGIRDKLSRGEFFCVELGQAVNGRIEPCGMGRREFVPGLKRGGIAETKCAAEVDYFEARFEKLRRKLRRHS